MRYAELYDADDDDDDDILRTSIMQICGIPECNMIAIDIFERLYPSVATKKS